MRHVARHAIVLGLAALCVTACSSEHREGEYASLDAALAAGGGSQRPVLVDFYTSW